MMVFSDNGQDPSPTFKPSRRRMKPIAIIILIVVVIGSVAFMLVPKNHRGGTAKDGSGTIIGTITGLDGHPVSSASVVISDSQGNAVDLQPVDQNGHYKVFLPNGDYVFHFDAGGSEVTREVKVDSSTSKTVDVKMDITFTP